MQNILRIINLLKSTHKRIVGVIIANVILGIGAMAVPYFFKLIVDQVSHLVASNNLPQAYSQVSRLLVMLAGVQLVLVLASYIKENLEDNLRLETFFSLRKKLMKHAMGLSLEYYETNQAGAISDNMTQGVYDFGLWLDDLAQTSLLQIITVSLTIVIISLRSPLAGLIAAVAAIIKIAISLSKIKHVGVYRKEGRKRFVQTQGLMVETIANMATVRSVSSETGVIDRFVRLYDNVREIRFRQIVLERRYNAAAGIVDAIGIVLVVGIIAYGAIGGRYTVGDVLLVAVYFTNAMGALVPLARFFDRTADVNVTAAGIVELLDVKPTVVDKPSAEVLTKLESIEFKGVSFHYPNHARDVLHDISFRLSGDRTVALVGPSGTGKTTITKLLMRFYEPTAGQILVNGHDITDFKQDSLRQHMGVVMQDVALFNSSFAENLRLSKPEATQADLDAAVRKAYLTEFVDELPEGYETQVGERGVKLSGGQKQRLAIARAMLRDPQLIVLDEATSALDSESERAVQKGLSELMRGRMGLIIAHRLSTVRHADEIVVIKRGKIIERGSHDELVKADGLYLRLYSMQGKL